MDRWLINGDPATQLSPDDRGLLYGDGLFETLAVRDGHIRLFDRHVARLDEGCRRLGLPAPDKATVQAELERVIDGAVSGTAKYIVTRGTGPRGYRPPANILPTRLAGFAAGSLTEARPLRVRSCQTRVGRNPALAGLKTLNRLEQVLASRELDDVDEGLMYDDRDLLVCGTMSNVFVRAPGGWLTPPLDHAGVAGVMRGVVLDAAREAGMRIDISPVTRDVVAAATSVVLTNAVRGPQRVKWLDGRELAAPDEWAQLRAPLALLGMAEWGL